MRFKWVAAGIVILASVSVWQVLAGQESTALKEDSQRAAGLIKFGQYLVNYAAMCGDCHTPQDDRGKSDRTRLLSGATLPIRPRKETPKWHDESPDITASGLAGDWSEEEMVTFLTTGVDPEGMKARPPMPAFRFSAEDARAIFLYLKSVPGQERAGKKDEK
jgi:mono/diheme cytochrome c family protein